MHESQILALGTAPGWTVQRQKKEVKRLKVMVEARFLLVQLPAEKVDFGAFLSKFREVGDLVFVPQNIRAFNEDGPDL